MCLKVFVFLVATFAFCNGDPVSFINKCKPDDSKCAKNSAQTAIPIFAGGLPEYGVEKLEPVVFKKIDASKAKLKFILHDVIVTGLSKCLAKRIQRDVANSKMYMKFSCDAKLESQYEMDGQLLILQIEGKGKLHVNLKKAAISVDADMSEKDGADGKKHWHIKSWKYSLDLKDKSELVFENLFNGNAVLGQAVNELIKTDGNSVVKEIGSPVFDAVVDKVILNINNFFNKVHPDDLSLD